MTPLFALSIDLDALDLYLGLYGLGEEVLDERAREAIPALAAQRFGELCDAVGLKGTLFVVGRDLARGRAHRELRDLHAAGHELASHSFAHDYALSRGTVAEIEADLTRAEDELHALTGAKPVGFRAPGYTLSDALLQAVANRGYAYDSSLLASPPYYAAKAAVIGALKLAGRQSRSILGDVRQLVGGRHPHRTMQGVLELPVAVLPGARLPYIGTLVTTIPSPASVLLARGLKRDPLVVLELHGADLVDGSDGVPPELLARQRDLAVPATVKRRRLEAAIRALLDGREARTLASCAALLGPRTE